jgi:pimeloyl-ACP methyl ester carboxylesterase
MNMAHPWVSPRTFAPHLWRLWYQVPLATVGANPRVHAEVAARAFKIASALDPETARVYVDRFHDPVVARAGRDTYRTFLLRELPEAARTSAGRATVPIRCLFGTGDVAIHPSLVAAETADADDYTLHLVDASHFIVDERPDDVRAALVALADETRR